MDPHVLKENCWKYVDRVVDICAKHNIYTILDLHALPGCHNPDWHSDNRTNHASNPELDEGHEEINAAPYALLDEQLRIYDTLAVHWSIWLYKDIGVQGMLHVSPTSPWLQLIVPFLKKKRHL